MEKRGIVLFLGAGISAPHPASGPLFGTVREALLRRIGVSATSTAAEALVGQTLPEVFLKLMSDAGLSLGQPLAEAVTGDLAGGPRIPNAVHRCVANLACTQDVTVWTTNWDEFIEQAASNVKDGGLRSATMYAAAEMDASAVRKPHGTASVPQSMLFSSAEVMLPLSSGWHELLVSEMEDSDVYVAGYGGADVDIYPSLREGLRRAHKVIWLEMSDELCRFQQWRFGLEPASFADAAKRRGHWSVKTDGSSGVMDPSNGLLKLLGYAMTAERPDFAAAREATDRAIGAADRTRVFGGGDALLMKARTYERVGARRQALLRHLWLVVVGPTRRHRARGASAIYNTIAFRPWRGRDPMLHLLRRVTSARRQDMTRVQLGRLDEKNDAAHIDLVLREPEAASIDEALTLAANERWLGDLRRAERLAGSALDRSRSQDLDSRERDWPERVSRAAYEFAQALFWQGRWMEAEEVCRSGLMNISGAKWAAWSLTLKAGASFLMHDSLSVHRIADEEFAKAIEILDAEGFVEFAVHPVCSRAALAREAGRLDDAEAHLENAIRRLGPGLGGRVATALETAELAVERSRPDVANELFMAVASTGRVLYANVARMRQHELGLPCEFSAAEVEAEFRRINCQWGSERVGSGLNSEEMAAHRYLL